MADDAYLYSQVGRALPSAYTDNTRVPARYSRYGEQYVQAVAGPRHSMADEGSYFVAHNITNDASTTLAGHPAPVLADADVTMTKPLVFMRMAANSLKRAYLDYIEIDVITAGATGSSDNWAAQLDTGATRYSSGTVETLTTVNPNMASTATPELVTLAGPVVVGVESASVRHLGHGQLRAAIEVAGDRKLFKFGGEPNLVNVVVTAATRHIVTLPPVVLGPTDQFLLALYQPAQNAAGVYKIRCGWFER